MKKGLITGAAVLLALGATAAQAHDPVEQRVGWLEKRLELTEEQRAQVQDIYTQAQEQREALREQQKEQSEALREQQKELRKAMAEQRQALREQSSAIDEATREQLAGVLTEDQNSKLSEMREGMNRRAIMRSGMQGRNRGRGMDRQRGMEGRNRGRGMNRQRVERQLEAVRRMLHQRQKESEAPAAEE